MAADDAHVLPDSLTPVLTQLSKTDVSGRVAKQDFVGYVGL